MGKKIPPYIVFVITNWCSHSMELQNSMEIPERRTVCRLLKKTKNTVAILSSNPTPGNIPSIPRQNYNSKRYMHPCVHSSSTNSQDVKAT